MASWCHMWADDTHLDVLSTYSMLQGKPSAPSCDSRAVEEGRRSERSTVSTTCFQHGSTSWMRGGHLERCCTSKPDGDEPVALEVKGLREAQPAAVASASTASEDHISAHAGRPKRPLHCDDAADEVALSDSSVRDDDQVENAETSGGRSEVGRARTVASDDESA